MEKEEGPIEGQQDGQQQCAIGANCAGLYRMNSFHFHLILPLSIIQVGAEPWCAILILECMEDLWRIPSLFPLIVFAYLDGPKILGRKMSQLCSNEFVEMEYRWFELINDIIKEWMSESEW